MAALAHAAPAPCEDRAAAARFEAMPIEAVSGVALDAGRDFRVDSITVVRQAVFNTADPAENRPMFRLANRYHVNTREHVIRTMLLFAEGERVAPGLLAESERVLRRRSYLYDARVVATRVCGDGIAVAVVTRDVWSLAPSLGLTRTGGEHVYEAGVSDSNLLGSGVDFDVQVFRDLDRRGASVGLGDTNLGDSRVGFRLRIDNTDDGAGGRATLGLPFHALDARRAWEVIVQETERDEVLYQAGSEVGRFRARRRLAEASVGRSAGLADGFATRWRAGFSFTDARFEPGTVDVAPDRAYAWPWVSWSRVEDEFARTRNATRVQTTEDVYLGSRADARLGYSPRSDGHLVGTFSYRNGLRWNGGGTLPESRDTLLFGLGLSGYWNTATRRAENAVASGWLNWRHRHTDKVSLHVDAVAAVAHGLTADQQLLLGGDTGMRGYPNRLQAGSRRVRITLEERYYSDLYLLRVLRVAAAAFLDVGRAWGGRAWRLADFPAPPGLDTTLANAGVGLRFESTRTSRDIVYHIDLATPLVDAPGAGGLELTLTGKRSL